MTIKLAHVSDLHIDERGRLADVVSVLDAFLQQAHERKVDLILVAGDCFERRSTPVERNVFATFLQSASAVAPVAISKGNHDAVEDLSIFRELAAESLIHVYDRPTVMPGSADIIFAGTAGDSIVAGLPKKGMVGILALPWFDKAHLVAGLDATVDAEATRQLTIEAAQSLLTCMRAEATRLRSLGAVPILVGHVMVAGSEVATGQTLIGTTVELSPSDLLEVGAEYAALGHIHMAQEWFGGRVAYSGSPHRCNFGERETKGWRLVTIDDDGKFLSNEFVELPARRMVLIECDWACPDGAVKLTGGPLDPNFFALDYMREVPGALVRFRYRVRAEHLHLVDREVIEKVFLADGAAEVKVEAVVVADTRVRSEEITKATSVAEKVQAYLTAKGIPVEPVQLDRLVSKLETLDVVDAEVPAEVRS